MLFEHGNLVDCHIQFSRRSLSVVIFVLPAFCAKWSLAHNSIVKRLQSRQPSTSYVNKHLRTRPTIERDYLLADISLNSKSVGQSCPHVAECPGSVARSTFYWSSQSCDGTAQDRLSVTAALVENLESAKERYLTYSTPTPHRPAIAIVFLKDILTPRRIAKGNKANAKSKNVLYAPPNVAYPAGLKITVLSTRNWLPKRPRGITLNERENASDGHGDREQHHVDVRKQFGPIHVWSQYP